MSNRSFVACLLAVVTVGSSMSIAAEPGRNIIRRGSYTNSQIKFEQEQKGHVAFIGGSITEMNGYRPMVCGDLQKRYPDTKFTFTAAGISSTCSTTGAFRLNRDVLSKGPVDLFFIEFAVNDDQDAGHARRECIRGMEGIIRQCRKHNPNIDIIVTFFVNPSMLEMLQNGKTPISMGSHTEVLEHYDVSTIHLAREAADRITAGTLTWKEYGGTHPKPPGNRIGADMIVRLLDDAWSKPLAKNAKPIAHPTPKDHLDEDSYSNGRFQSLDTASTDGGWKVHKPEWKNIPGGKRARFTSIPLLCATEPGSETTVKFTGKAVGAFVVAGPDAGIVEASIDGGDFKKVDLFHRFSRGLHYPRTVMFAADLDDGDHLLRLRISAAANKDSKGHAARIIQFAVN
ncbi:MAG: SGNH/GDSL hydrolase family protein [Planctomycetales bacterium]|jgi:lysophospholipase L1-like esterase